MSYQPQKPGTQRAVTRPMRLAAIVALMFSITGTSSAQDWKAGWDKTIAAAKKEGSVVIGVPSSASHRQFLQIEWAKAYPEIDLLQTVVAGGTWVQKVRIERGADKYLWDLAITGAVACYQMKEAGFIDPITPEFIVPEVKDPKAWGGWDNAFFDTDHKYVMATRAFLKMPFYNAKLLSPEKVKAMGRRVLVAPELKGKVVWHDPTIPGSGESFAPVIRRLLGDQDFKTFIQEQVVFVSKASDAVERTVRDQFAIAMGPVLTGELQTYVDAGLKLDIRPLGNTPEFGAYANTGGSNLIVIKDRPHPNATKVFLNWFLSRDVQAAIAKSQLEDTQRTDVAPVSPQAEQKLAGVKYFEAQREEHLPELKSALQFIRDNRKK